MAFLDKHTQVNKIENLALYPSISLPTRSLLLPGLQSLHVHGDDLNFEAGSLTGLSSLTSLEIKNAVATIESNSFPHFLLAFKLLGKNNLQCTRVQGFENIHETRVSTDSPHAFNSWSFRSLQ